MRQFVTYWFFLLSGLTSFSQVDSIELVMNYDQFIHIVKEHHPLAKQADLRIQLGEAYLLKSKGGFDPQLNGNVDQKYFEDEQYYNIISTGLKIPTWYGVSVHAGYDLTGGSQLNPERSLPDDGLWYAGLNLSLGKGLITDQRRAEYKKAKIYLESTVQQQRQMLNELYLQASLTYWEWFKSYNKMMIYQDAVDNALERFIGVREEALLGDKPMMDTVEAFIQLQSRMFNYLDAQLDYTNNTELIELYLWEDGTIPLEIDSTLSPPNSSSISSNNIDAGLILKLDSIRLFHPDLLNAQYIIDQKKVDLQLGRENLKPEVNLKYNAITANGSGNIADNYSVNNYKWGASFKFPLFLRKERGALRINKLELENLNYDLAFKTEQIHYKIETAINRWSTSFKQYELWRKTTDQYQILLQSEETLFQIGESSLFMINSREKAYINAQLQLMEVITENKKAEIKTRHAMGVLFNSI